MKIYISLFLLAFSMVLTAQPTRSVSYETLLEVAEESLQKNDYVSAIEYYDKAYQESRDKDLAINIAQLNLITRNYKKASKMYERVFKKDEEKRYKEDRILYAKSLKSEGRYKEALQNFNQFIEETEDEEMKQVAFLDIMGIQSISDMEENISTDLTFMDKEINSNSAESSPNKYVDGELYFSSFNRKDEIILDGDEGDYYAKIYKISKDDEGKWDKASALSSKINREDYHTANPSFSADGQQMYFTRTLLEGNEVVESKIYVSSKHATGWTAAREININGDFIAKHPRVGELYGNDVIFFSADIEGGEGGLDLYYSTIEGDDYATPINLGPSINTSNDEVTPFYADGTLYFSSDGYPSLGGMDIFYTSWDGSAWNEVTNMGFVYNSPLDDMYFTLSQDGSGGYLVSNRPDKKKKKMKGNATCCDDVYAFNIRTIVIDLHTIALDEAGEPMSDVTIDITDLTMDRDTKSKTNLESHEFSFLLDSDHKYVVVAKKEGFFPDTISFNTMGIVDDFTVEKTVTLKAKPVVEEPEVEIITKNEAIRLNNIYYDFDDDKILADAEKDLEVLFGLMESYPTMTIELSSHTDSQGKAGYNRKLSQRRAESAKAWLVRQGIDQDRIKPVGYGERVILNHCKNRVKCTDDEHRVNRRTEFKMIDGPDSIELIRE